MLNYQYKKPEEQISVPAGQKNGGIKLCFVLCVTLVLKALQSL